MSERMSLARLAEIDAMLEEITLQGRYWNCVGLHPHAGDRSLLTVRPNGGGVWFTNEDDAYFVAAAPEIIRELRGEIDRLKGVIVELIESDMAGR